MSAKRQCRDLLCSARRPAYRSDAERRHQLGVGAPTHSDVVVRVEASRTRLLTIGSVPRAVSLKLLPAADDGPYGRLRPLPTKRRIFAHLKLRTRPLAPDSLHRTPTMRAVQCREAVGCRPTQRPPASSSALPSAERMLITSASFGGPDRSVPRPGPPLGRRSDRKVPAP